MQDFQGDPYNFITNHNNTDIFLAIFSNYTKSDASFYLEKYLDNSKREIQNYIDKINNIKNNYIFNWEYDAQKKQFTLPDESTIDFFS